MNYRNILKRHSEKQIEILNKSYIVKPTTCSYEAELKSFANNNILEDIRDWKKYILKIPKFSYEEMIEEIKRYKKFRKTINNRNYLK